MRGADADNLAGAGPDVPNARRREAARMVDAYGDLVLRVAFNRLGSMQDAQDVCQTVFLKLVRRIVTDGVPFEGEEHERAWVIRVALSSCADLLRSSWRRRVVPWDEEAAQEVERCREMHDVAEGSEVRAAVEALPARYREAVYLYYFEGFSAKEIAEATGRTLSAVNKHLSRGRAKLRAYLEEGETP